MAADAAAQDKNAITRCHAEESACKELTSHEVHGWSFI